MEFLTKQVCIELWAVVVILALVFLSGVAVAIAVSKIKLDREDETIEPHEVISTKQVRKSTKEFKCVECGDPIPEGSSYVRVSYRTSTGMGSAAYHNECIQ